MTRTPTASGRRAGSGNQSQQQSTCARQNGRDDVQCAPRRSFEASPDQPNGQAAARIGRIQSTLYRGAFAHSTDDKPEKQTVSCAGLRVMRLMTLRVITSTPSLDLLDSRAKFHFRAGRFFGEDIFPGLPHFTTVTLTGMTARDGGFRIERGVKLQAFRTPSRT